MSVKNHCRRASARLHNSRATCYIEGADCTITTRELVDMLVASTSPNLLYVLGIPGGSLLVVVLLSYGLYRLLSRFEH